MYTLYGSRTIQQKTEEKCSFTVVYTNDLISSPCGFLQRRYSFVQMILCCCDCIHRADNYLHNKQETKQHLQFLVRSWGAWVRTDAHSKLSVSTLQLVLVGEEELEYKLQRLDPHRIHLQTDSINLHTWKIIFPLYKMIKRSYLTELNKK